MLNRILVGYTESEQGQDAIALGCVLAQAGNAEMMLSTPRTPVCG